MAEDLTNAGYTLQVVCKLPIKLTQDNFKENVVKPVMKALHPDKTSTTELTTIELTEVYDAVNLAIGEKFGVSRLFPSEEDFAKRS
jgi:hypothetical protein